MTLESLFAHPLAPYGLLVAALLSALAAAPLIVLARMSARAAADRRREEMRDAEWRRSLAQLLETQSALGGRLAQQAEAQAHFRKTVDERLDQVSGGVSRSLAEQTERTGETLKALAERLAVIDEARKSFAETSAALSTQVGGLSDILSNKQKRGAFGEIQMADLVRDALPARAFDLQATLSTGARPDCLIRLPNPPGPIAVDSKFPLDAYRAWAEAEDDAARETAKRRLRDDVRTHAEAIAKKYLVPGETADWAVMFLPSETVFSALHAEFPASVQACLNLRVGVVSPNTFMALLTTVRAVLQDAEMREKAAEVQKFVGLMMEDLDRLKDRIDKAANSHATAAKHLGDAQTSVARFETRARKVQSLELDEDAPALVRPPRAAE